MPRNAVANSFEVGKAGRLILGDLGLSPRRVLERSGLSTQLLDSADSKLPATELFKLWRVVEQEVSDPCFALRVGQSTQIESFSPSFFASMCSPDFNTAATRLDQYKRLVSFFCWDLSISEAITRIDYRCRSRIDMPFSMGLAQIVFLVSFTRRATRHHLAPHGIVLTRLPQRAEAYEEWFGCEIAIGNKPGLLLNAEDARRPFLTHDEQMWAFFEPALRREMQDARTLTTMRERVEGALMELLPNGRSQIGDVAGQFAISSRSLQRRLAEEGTSWLAVLGDVRAGLACHYLRSTALDLAEISRRLGFDDTNSLYRAFRKWKGMTPDVWRAQSRRSTSVSPYS